MQGEAVAKKWYSLVSLFHTIFLGLNDRSRQMTISIRSSVDWVVPSELNYKYEFCRLSLQGLLFGKWLRRLSHSIIVAYSAMRNRTPFLYHIWHFNYHRNRPIPDLLARSSTSLLFLYVGIFFNRWSFFFRLHCTKRDSSLRRLHWNFWWLLVKNDFLQKLACV